MDSPHLFSRGFLRGRSSNLEWNYFVSSAEFRETRRQLKRTFIRRESKPRANYTSPVIYLNLPTARDRTQSVIARAADKSAGVNAAMCLAVDSSWRQINNSKSRRTSLRFLCVLPVWQITSGSFITVVFFLFSFTFLCIFYFSILYFVYIFYFRVVYIISIFLLFSYFSLYLLFFYFLFHIWFIFSIFR